MEVVIALITILVIFGGSISVVNFLDRGFEEDMRMLRKRQTELIEAINKYHEKRIGTGGMICVHDVSSYFGRPVSPYTRPDGSLGLRYSRCWRSGCNRREY